MAPSDSIQGEVGKDLGKRAPHRYRIRAWAGWYVMLTWLALALVDPEPFTDDAGILCYVGLIFGLVSLAAAWAALGPGAIAWRVPVSLGWVVMVAVAVSTNLADGDQFVEMAIVFTIQWVLMQLPLWVLVLATGLRVRYLEDWLSPGDRPDWQFSLRHLLVLTALVAAALGTGRILVAWLGESLAPDGAAIFLVVAAVIQALPLLLAGLLPQRAITGVVVVLVLIGLGSIWEASLFRQIILSSPGPKARGAFLWINVSLAAVVLSGVLLVRLCGYGTRPKVARLGESCHYPKYGITVGCHSRSLGPMRCES